MKKSRKTLKRANQNVSVDQVISNRILILTLTIVVCFLVIFLRLFYLQIISYNDYTAKREDYTSIKQYTSAPRGQIYDCKGRILAKTVVSHNIVFTSPNNFDEDDYELYAKRIVKVFSVSAKDFTDEDKKQAYITYKSFLSPSDSEYAANHLLTAKELKQYKNGAWGDDAESKRYQILMNRIGKKQIGEMSQADLKMCVIYQRMVANQSTGQENVVLEDVSDDDVAYLVEHKTDFPGFDVDFGGWKREYPYGESLSDVLGSVTTSTQGLPSELASYYLSKGYQYNASVGKSGLEYQYNDLLAGTPEIAKITYDSKGLAQKEVIQEAKKGYDIHTKTAADVNHVPIELVTKEMRRKAKAVNFGIIYGISSFGLSEDLRISPTEAKMFIEDYFNTYPGVKDYMNKEAYEKGYVKTITNRKRIIEELNNKNYMIRSMGERMALNTPIQGTAADILKIAMIKIDKEIETRKLKSKMLLQVHDELIFNIPKEEKEIMEKLVTDIMDSAYKLNVPLVVDVSFGNNWYEAK